MIKLSEELLFLARFLADQQGVGDLPTVDGRNPANHLGSMKTL